LFKRPIDLQPGDIAPDFELEGSDQRIYRLRDYIGKRPVVIAWFPKAFTGG
jgi:peroxiredoxin Q/BCP